MCSEGLFQSHTQTQRASYTKTNIFIALAHTCHPCHKSSASERKPIIIEWFLSLKQTHHDPKSHLNFSQTFKTVANERIFQQTLTLPWWRHLWRLFRSAEYRQNYHLVASRSGLLHRVWKTAWDARLYLEAPLWRVQRTALLGIPLVKHTEWMLWIRGTPASAISAYLWVMMIQSPTTERRTLLSER